MRSGPISTAFRMREEAVDFEDAQRGMELVRNSVLDEARSIIGGERAVAYGPAERNLGNIALQWALYLSQRYGIELTLTAEDVGWMMSDLKKCRQMHSNKRDNFVDALGYVALAAETVKSE